MSAAPRVLVVDDEPQIVRGLKIILRDAGYTVEAAETKAQALAALGSRPPEALVLDLKLPDGEGVEVCREVRRFSQLPIQPAEPLKLQFDAFLDAVESRRQPKLDGRRARQRRALPSADEIVALLGHHLTRTSPGKRR